MSRQCLQGLLFFRITLRLKTSEMHRISQPAMPGLAFTLSGTRCLSIDIIFYASIQPMILRDAYTIATGVVTILKFVVGTYFYLYILRRPNLCQSLHAHITLSPDKSTSHRMITLCRVQENLQLLYCAESLFTFLIRSNYDVMTRQHQSETTIIEWATHAGYATLITPLTDRTSTRD